MQVGEPAVLHTGAKRKRRWRRRLFRAALGVIALALLAVGVLFWSSDWGATLGGRIQGDRLDRVNASPNFRDGKAQNEIETTLGSGNVGEFLVEYFRGAEKRIPPEPVPMVQPEPAELAALRDPGIRLIWLGHSTVYLEVDGTRVLIDPVFSDRASPFAIVGPRRSHPVPVALADLPMVDVVVISHDHYDHLDPGVVRDLAPLGVRFAVPLGVGADLEAWGAAAEQIIELDWWEDAMVGSLRLIATPARHFSGWQVTDRDRTLWASWVILGPRSRVYYSGDTGWHDGFAAVGEDFGPFDLTIIKCGAYGDGWPDIHLDGAQAVEAHLALRGRRMLPVHWLTFDLALHPWAEPIEQVVSTAGRLEADVITPRLGELVDLRGRPSFDRWWESVGTQ